jgi:hypothetical protein
VDSTRDVNHELTSPVDQLLIARPATPPAVRRLAPLERVPTDRGERPPRERGVGVRVVDDLDHLAVAKGGEIGDGRGRLVRVGRRPHDDDDPVTRADHVDELEPAAADDL